MPTDTSNQTIGDTTALPPLPVQASATVDAPTSISTSTNSKTTNTLKTNKDSLATDTSNQIIDDTNALPPLPVQASETVDEPTLNSTSTASKKTMIVNNPYKKKGEKK